jgi:hypothetical protein
METEKINIKTKPDLNATLTGLPLGVEFVIENHLFKPIYVRQRVAKLKEKGFSFKVSETGMRSGCKVTRLK